MVRIHPHARTRDKHKIKDSLTTYCHDDGHKVYLNLFPFIEIEESWKGMVKYWWMKIGWEGKMFLLTEFSVHCLNGPKMFKPISFCCKMSDYRSINTRLAPNQWTEYRMFVVLQHGSWFCPGCNLPKCHSYSWDTQGATSDPTSNTIVGNDREWQSNPSQQ